MNSKLAKLFVIFFALLAIAIIGGAQLWAAESTATCSTSGSVYPTAPDGWAYSKHVFLWFTVEGKNPTVANATTDEGWKCFITFSPTSGLSFRTDFLKPDGKSNQRIWLQANELDAFQAAVVQYWLNAGQTTQVRMFALADNGVPVSGLGTGSVIVRLFSPDPCILDQAVKLLGLTFYYQRSDGSVINIASVKAVRVDQATNVAEIGVSYTPSWASYTTKETTSFALMNLGDVSQTVTATLYDSHGVLLAQKDIPLQAMETTGLEASEFFGIDKLAAKSPFVGKIVFKGTGKLAAMPLQFIGGNMGAGI